MSVRLSVASAAKLFNTEFLQFHSASSNRTLHRALAYSLPAQLAALIDHVAGVTTFPPVHPPRIRRSVSVRVSVRVCGVCLTCVFLRASFDFFTS